MNDERASVLFCDLAAARICRIAKPASRQELFAQLAEGLALPGGPASWDDLSDQLQDLAWLQGQEAVLVHESLEGLPQADRETYLDILASASAWWQLQAARQGDAKRLSLVLSRAEASRFGVKRRSSKAICSFRGAYADRGKGMSAARSDARANPPPPAGSGGSAVARTACRG